MGLARPRSESQRSRGTRLAAEHGHAPQADARRPEGRDLGRPEDAAERGVGDGDRARRQHLDALEPGRAQPADVVRLVDGPQNPKTPSYLHERHEQILEIQSALFFFKIIKYIKMPFSLS